MDDFVQKRFEESADFTALHLVSRIEWMENGPNQGVLVGGGKFDEF